MGQLNDYQLSFLEDAAPSATFTREEHEILHSARTIFARRFAEGTVLTRPEEVKEYLCLRLAEYQYEVFGCIYLTNRHCIIRMHEIFTGMIDGATVYPRVVVQQALRHNAAALVLHHNHPSGVPEPSQADQAISKRLVEALQLVDIRVLDHIVVAPRVRIVRRIGTSLKCEVVRHRAQPSRVFAREGSTYLRVCAASQ